MHSEGSTPENLPFAASPQEPEPEATLPPMDLPGAGLVRRPMLTVDSEPASGSPDEAREVGRIPHPRGKPVVVELPADPSVLTAKALHLLAELAEGLSQAPATGEKKAGHDGPAKSNREVKTMSAKHHRLREPK